MTVRYLPPEGTTLESLYGRDNNVCYQCGYSARWRVKEPETANMKVVSHWCDIHLPDRFVDAADDRTGRMDVMTWQERVLYRAMRRNWYFTQALKGNPWLGLIAGNAHKDGRKIGLGAESGGDYRGTRMLPLLQCIVTDYSVESLRTLDVAIPFLKIGICAPPWRDHVTANSYACRNWLLLHGTREDIVDGRLTLALQHAVEFRLHTLRDEHGYRI